MRCGTCTGLGLVFLGSFVLAQAPPATRAPARPAVVAPAPARPAVVSPAPARPAAAPVQVQPAAAPAPVALAAGPADAAVTNHLAGFVKAYNARNAAGLAEFFSDDATLIDLDGKVTQGKAAVGAQFASGFAQPTNYTLESTVESLRYITPDVAQVEGTSKLSAPNESAIVNRFVTLVAKKDNLWKIAEIRDLPAAEDDVPPADRLKEFEWMIGDWVDQTGNMKINSSIKWGDNQAFMLRSTTVHIGDEKGTSSLMILAWDPRSGQIKSWLFDSEGGRGEGTWTRASDNQWIIRAEGTLRNGTPTSATQTVTLVGKDAVKTSSLDRIIGGEVAPDIDEVMMVRKPPVAGGAVAPSR
jgi:uncharacterized protein (TIGR02246 family)